MILTMRVISRMSINPSVLISNLCFSNILGLLVLLTRNWNKSVLSFFKQIGTLGQLFSLSQPQLQRQLDPI